MQPLVRPAQAAAACHGRSGADCRRLHTALVPHPCPSVTPLTLPSAPRPAPPLQFAGERNVVFVEGTTILDYYSLAGINMWGWLGIEACFVVVFCLFAYLALRYVRHVKR